MNWTLLATCLLIAFARITDITLDTVRTVAIVQGRRKFAAILGFFEALIYIIAVAKVLQNFDRPIYAIAYAGGFSIGTYLGIAIEQRLALGDQIVSIFTRKGEILAAALRSMGYKVTEFTGRGRDGEISALYIQLSRRHAPKALADARVIDPDCYYLVHDVRLARSNPSGGPQPTNLAA